MPGAAVLFDPSNTHVRTLDNGLTVLVRQDRSAPVVAIVTHVRAGYFDEPDELVGIAHVLEHMYFKGTPSHGVGEIARATKAAGGYLNAGTIYDRTSYYTVLPSSSFEAGLAVQADALANSVIEAEELRKELLVIIQEAKRKLDSPGAVAQESLFELLFDVHRMRRWRIGTETQLAGYTRDDVMRFYRAHYRPERIVLAIVGDIDVEAALRSVERLYGSLEPGAAPIDRGPAEPPRRGFRLREMHGDIAQGHLEMGWRTPDTLHEHTAALDMLAITLGAGRASRLYRSVRDAGLASSVSAYHYTPTELGVFGVSAEPAPEHAKRTIAAIGHVIDRVRSERISDSELERARNIIEARMIRRFETMDAQANVLAEWQALGDWRMADDHHQRLLSVSAEDLRAAAARYLDPELAALLLYRPERARPLDADADTLLAEIAATTGIAAPPIEEPPHTPGIGPPLTNVAVPRRELRDGNVHVYAADNGVRVVVEPRRSVPLVSLAVSCRGAGLAETPAESGITGLLARGSIRGTLRSSAHALALRTEALGGAITPAVNADLLEWDLNVPSRHFDAGLDLLAEAVLEPTFPEAELERERDYALQDIEQVRDDMYRYPLRLFMQAAFADHPYGYDIGATERALATIDRAQVVDWHLHEVLRGSPTTLMVGDVEPEAAAAAVASRFERVQPVHREPPALPPEWPLRATVQADHRDKAQTALVVGFPGPPRSDSDVYALQLFANVISGLGGRLFEELRSRRSLAYSVSAFPLARWQAGAFVTYIATSPEREDEAREALLDELAAAIAAPLAAEDVERAKRYTIGTWRIRGQTNGAHLSELVSALLLGSGVHEIRAFESCIDAITAEQIMHTARRYLDPDRAVIGVVRGTGRSR
jgi:zinc protease